MNSKELYIKDKNNEEKFTGIYVCAECRYISKTKEKADECCMDIFCSECGKVVGKKNKDFILTCSDCSSQRYWGRKEIVMPNDIDMFYYNDTYMNADELYDHLSEQTNVDVESDKETIKVIANLAVPYVIPCTKEVFKGITDIDNVVYEQYGDELPEEYEVKDMEYLRNAVDLFNKSQTDYYYMAENNKKVHIMDVLFSFAVKYIVKANDNKQVKD